MPASPSSQFPSTEILQMPVPELMQRARTGVRLFEAMLEYMADSMAEELRRNNLAGAPTRWILPVGPVKPFRLVDICNREGISWRNMDLFQMDEFLEWQGRFLSITR